MEDGRKNRSLRWKEWRLVQHQITTLVASTLATVLSSGTVSGASALTMMATKNRPRSEDFRPRMGLREEKKEGRREENVEGLVHK